MDADVAYTWCIFVTWLVNFLTFDPVAVARNSQEQREVRQPTPALLPRTRLHIWHRRTGERLQLPHISLLAATLSRLLWGHARRWVVARTSLRLLCYLEQASWGDGDGNQRTHALVAAVAQSGEVAPDTTTRSHKWSREAVVEATNAVSSSSSSSVLINVKITARSEVELHKWRVFGLLHEMVKMVLLL